MFGLSISWHVVKVDMCHNSDEFVVQSIGFNLCHLILIYYGWYTWKMSTFIGTYCFSLFLLFFLITFCANTWEMCDKLLISSSIYNLSSNESNLYSNQKLCSSVVLNDLLYGKNHNSNLHSLTSCKNLFKKIPSRPLGNNWIIIKLIPKKKKLSIFSTKHNLLSTILLSFPFLIIIIILKQTINCC